MAGQRDLLIAFQFKDKRSGSMMDTMKNLETFDTKSVLDSTMKMELLKAWTFELTEKISNGAVEASDAIESLERASDALDVARHYLLSDAVAESVNEIVYHRLVTEVLDISNGINLCLTAMKDLSD